MLAFVVMEHFKRSVKTAYYSVNLPIPQVYFLFYFFKENTKTIIACGLPRTPQMDTQKSLPFFKYVHTVYACTTIQHRNTIHMKIVGLRH